MDEAQGAYECACMLMDDKQDQMSGWEFDRISSMKEQYEEKTWLSEKQIAVINRVFDKHMNSLR